MKLNFNWNVPNVLTIVRMILVIPICLMLYINSFAAYLCATILIVVAAVSDILDGTLARNFKEETSFGKFMDPLADKVFVIPIFFAFYLLDETLFPLWLPIIILIREAGITLLRSTALTKKKEMSTMKMGKTKTVIQLFTLGLLCLLYTIHYYYIDFDPTFQAYYSLNFREFSLVFYGDYGIYMAYLPLFLVSLSAFISIFSGLEYLIRNRHLLKKQTMPNNP